MPNTLDRRLDAVLAALCEHARPEQLGAMARFGLTGDARLGLAVPTPRLLARQFGRDHELALALWDTAVPDAQILAGMVAEPASLSAAQMDHWVAGMCAWDVCDQACTNAFVKSPLAWAAIPRWAAREAEFEKRAGFALLAVAAVHQKQRPDADFLARLPLIEAAADDERNFVKKAVNWALRQIGKRSVSQHSPSRSGCVGAARNRRAGSAAMRGGSCCARPEPGRPTPLHLPLWRDVGGMRGAPSPLVPP